MSYRLVVRKKSLRVDFKILHCTGSKFLSLKKYSAIFQVIKNISKVYMPIEVLCEQFTSGSVTHSRGGKN